MKSTVAIMKSYGATVSTKAPIKIEEDYIYIPRIAIVNLGATRISFEVIV